MSRIGKIPVVIPADVKVNVRAGHVEAYGPKGMLSRTYNKLVKIENSMAEIVVIPVNASQAANAAQGLYRNLINNMLRGVATGFSKSLIVNGVGYRAEVQGKMLIMNLGYSVDFIAMIPEGITVSTDAQGKIIVSGIDNQKVGEFCAQIRNLRQPEPYKGKGIRYETETIRRKIGKSGVK